MPRLFKQLSLGLAIMLSGLVATPANAQATRTWVSGVGDDVNPCSRTAPCKTFAGAISKTAAGGEINCLDPGGFGAVTITKSLTISCPYTEGGALAGGNGITVNAGPADVVVLRGLDIFGVNPPSNGVRFIAGGALHIENSIIRRFNAANSAGVSFAPTGNSELFITDTVITQNGNGATGGGVVIRPGAAGTGKVTLTNVRILDNANNGLSVDTTGSSGPGVFVSVENSVIAGNGNGIRALHAVGAQGMLLTINSVAIVNNSGVGIRGDGTAATMRVGDSTIAGNAGLGVSQVNGSVINSYGDNRLNDNSGGNGTFTAPLLPKT
jgi:hypothetical protein